MPTRVHRSALVEPGSRQIELLSCLLGGESHYPVADDPGVDILRRLSPIELKQDRTASVYGDLAQHLPVEQVLAHDSKGLFEPGAIESFAAVHGAVSLVSRCISRNGFWLARAAMYAERSRGVKSA